MSIRLQTRWLVFRHQVGWGQFAPSAESSGYLALFFCFAGTVFDMMVFSGLVEALHTHDSSRFGSTLILACLLLVGEAFLLGAGIIKLKQAAQARVGELFPIQGNCFALLYPPPQRETVRPARRGTRQANAHLSEVPVIFARIGPSVQHAKWYVLPSVWQEGLEDPHTQLELEVLRGTQWVARLNQFDRRNELRWAAAHLPIQLYRASHEDVRDLQRHFQRAARGWGFPSERALRAFFMLIGIGVPLVMFLVIGGGTVLRFHEILGPRFPLVFLVYSALLMILSGIGFLVISIQISYQVLHAWHLGKQAQERLTVTGRVVGVWPVNGLVLKADEVHLIGVQKANGAKKFLAVGAAFQERLPEVGDSIRVTYLAKAEIVIQLEKISS